MPRICQLPHNVVTKIAAGEVIERPASVVKELLENSLDAGSTRIDIDVEQGGTERIRIVDDGCGMHGDDLRLAFSSHATSKLRDADDLFRISTLGFRGEALASIGGVSQVTLQSRPAGEATGAEILCNGGEFQGPRAWNGAFGTRIEVRHLFYNTPVRRKFLRTVATEMGHIDEAVTRVALSHPTLHLTLRHNDKAVYEIPGTAGLQERIGLFFGADVRDRLYEIGADRGAVRLRGLIADPACERGSARMQYLFVNGRWIRDRGLGHAVQEAYRGLLMTGRYAVTFLFLDMPPDQVDVNVHPTKSEVRFRDSQAAYHLVFTTIRDRLRAENLTAKLHVTSTLDTPVGLQSAPSPASWSLTPEPPALPELPFPARPAPIPVAPRANEPALDSAPSVGNGLPEHVLGGQSQPVVGGPPGEPQRALQLYDAYLVLETPEGMLVIDQHALHERILFEQLKERIRSGPLETQHLLIPEPVELPVEHAARLLETRDSLAGLGLQVSDFGGGTVLLSSYPAILGGRSPAATLRAVVDYLVAKDRLPSPEVLLNDLLSLMACHAAVRSGDRLTPEQIAALVEQRQLAQDVHHCPHGRPTALLFTRHDLDRQFRRI